MLDRHDGCKVFLEPPPRGDLPVAPGSQPTAPGIASQPSSQSYLTTGPPIGLQMPDAAIRHQLCSGSVSPNGLQPATGAKRETFAASPHGTKNWTLLARTFWRVNRRSPAGVEAPRDTPGWLRSSPVFTPAPMELPDESSSQEAPLQGAAPPVILGQNYFGRDEFSRDEFERNDELPLHFGLQLDDCRAYRGRSPNAGLERSLAARETTSRLPLPPAALSAPSRAPLTMTPTSPVLPLVAPPSQTLRPLPLVRFDDRVLPFRAPVKQTLAVFSLTGGTGRTSLAAGLARLLAGNGLRVLLVDTSSFSLLPRLFGAANSRQGAIRKFVPASGERNRTISLISLAVEPFAGDEYEQYRILQELQRHAARVDRVVWDLSGASLDWAAKVFGAAPQILVPLLPDTNSLVQLHATARFLSRCHDEDPSPHLRYVINQFDEQDALHREMRDHFRKVLGSKLLQTPLRRSPLIGEALSRGKTIIDYAPASSLVCDLRQIAVHLHQLDAHDELPSHMSSEWYER